ncbi:MAG TPA: hypothetical protein VGM84_19675 [Steroidobacteraceae bacterium]|jgi:hypothetical protein
MFFAFLYAVMGTDTLDVRGVVKASVVHVFEDVAQSSVRFANAVAVHVDLASFRKAAGLPDDVPDDWQSIASLAGGKGDVRRTHDVERCASTTGKPACAGLPVGEALIHAASLIQSAGHLRIVVVAVWSNPASSSMRVFNVDFTRAGQGYTYDSTTLWLIH